MPKRKDDDRQPVRLTDTQRDALLAVPRLRVGLRKRLREAPADGPTLTPAERAELADAAEDAAGFLFPPLPAALRAAAKKLAVAPTTAVAAVGTTPAGFRLKVTLEDIRPPVWRRLAVPDGTLEELHRHLQAAFGWDGHHLHQFEVGRKFYGVVFDDDDDFGLRTLDERQMTVGRLVAAGWDRWVYEYDMGDGWRHRVEVEGAEAVAEPACLGGARACPPEDCGGAPGYEHLLEALADRKHPDHRELKAWLGRPFDPERFDADESTRALRGLPRR